MRTVRFILSLATAVLMVGCGTGGETATDTARSGTSPASSCAARPPADTGTPAGWLGYLAAHPDRYTLDLRTLDGQRIEHNADAKTPTASAIKLVHLAAYAEAVAAGRLDPDATVSVDDWERWYFPLDGNAHPQSLRYLKIPETNGVATDRQQRVSYRQLADVMIRFSDSAAPDLLREKLGDDALLGVMRRYGFGDDVPGFLGLYLAVVDPSLVTAAQRDAAARRYGTDPSFAARQISAIATADTTADTIGSTITAPAAALTDLITAIADDSFGPGSASAREILEYQGPQSDGSVIGFKGGSLPGVVTDVFEYRTADGRRATGTLLVHDLSAEDEARNLDPERGGYAHQKFLLGALTSASAAEKLRCIM